MSRVTILITHIRGLIAPLMTTHEPPSTFHPDQIAPLVPASLANDRELAEGSLRQLDVQAN